MPDKIVIKNALLISGSTRFGDSSTARHQITGSSFFKGDVEVSGTLVANELKVNVVNQQVTNISATGSTSFGDSDDDIHSFTGKIGIGTVSPGASLEINDEHPKLLFKTNHSHGDSQILFKNAASTQLFNMRCDTTSNTLNHFAFSAGTAEDHFVIDPSGRVGIGTTSPGALLELNDEHPKLLLRSADDGDGQIIFQSGDGSTMANIRCDVTNNLLNHLAISANANENHLVVDQSGYVGIGTTSPTEKLEVAGNVVPGSDNSHDLGSPSRRWANLYTGDLHLKNDRGDWTVIEEEEYLSIRNNKTGKIYKMVLEEIKD